MSITVSTAAPRTSTVTPPPANVAEIHVDIPPSPPAAWTAWLALLPAAVIGYITQIGAAEREIWVDENATYHSISVMWADLLRLFTHMDLVHAAYYIFMRGWYEVFGSSMFALRMPSIIAMALTGAFTFLIGRRLVSTPVGLVAGLLLATIPAVSRYAEEARSYAPVTMLVTAATLLLLRALERPTGPRWTLYVVVASLAALGHFVAFTAVGGHILYVLLATRSSDETRRWRFAGAIGAVILVILPLIAAASRQTSQVGWITADSDRLTNFPLRIFMSDQLAMVVIGLAFLGVLVLWKRNRAGAVLLLGWAVGPVAFVYASAPVLKLFVARYVLFTVPAWALLAAATLCFLFRPLGKKPHGAAWFIAPLLALPALGYLGLPDQKTLRQSPVAGQPSYQPAFQYIRDHQQAGDGVVWNDKLGGRHDQARAMANYAWRDGGGPRDLLLAETAAQRGYFEAKDCADVPACLSGATRIWLLTTDSPPAPWTGMPTEVEKILSSGFTIKDDQNFLRVRVVLLERNPK